MSNMMMMGVGGETAVGFGGSSGGGSGATVSVLTSTNISGTLSPWTISGITFSSGLCVVGVVNDTVAFPPPVGITVNGVACTKIGATIADPGFNSVSLWAAVVTAGTSNIAIASSGASFGNIAFNSWLIQGLASSSPTGTSSFDGFNPQVADPQGPMSSLTVNSNGAAILVVGGTFVALPATTTWAPAAVTRDTGAETGTTAGNTIRLAGAHLTTAGTYTNITVSGSSVSWQYCGMVGAAWS